MKRKIVIPITVPLAGAVILAIAFLVSRNGNKSETSPRPSSVDKVETRKVEGNHWVVSRRERENYLRDLAAVTNQISLKPSPGKEENSVTELTIVGIAEGCPMHFAGFRKDDRILRINGTPVMTMERALNLVHEIKAAETLTVQVQRGDKLIDYQFEFR